MQGKVKMVCGVGVNDSDYPVSIYAVVDRRKRKIWVCPVYRAWASILERCHSAKYQARWPSYIGCSVDPGWMEFSTFRAWVVTQDHEGGQLDKDILRPGNKVYGPDACVFVSGQLNNFLTDSGSARGEFPIGVDWHKTRSKFRAICRNPFTRKSEYLGYFACPDAAHESWRARKHEHACTYADMQTDPRIAAALRSRYAGQMGAMP